MDAPPANARLVVDTQAIAANWRRFAAAGGAADCGAAVKADGYGLGADRVAAALTGAGCRDLFVAHWGEVSGVGALAAGVRLAVLHGVTEAEMPAALASSVVPVLGTPAQIQAWRATGRRCDVMIDTGINRLGLSPADAVSGLLDGLVIDTLHSHLACGEEPGHPLNERQRVAFVELAGRLPARRYGLANSGGIGFGAGYHFGLTRPGIGLFGGGSGPDGRPLAPVIAVSARILQVRAIEAGATIGYGATFTATRAMRLATAAIGYADGYPRSLSNRGRGRFQGVACPVVGRISMDMTIFDVTDAPGAREGDWIEIDLALGATAAASGRSEYELLTGLGSRYARIYR